MAIDRTEFPVFKGIQKPLEFMGIRGRFLMFAAATIGISFLAFIISSIVIGKLGGFIVMMITIGGGLATIYIKQKQGLHNKRIDKGIVIYKTLKKS